MKFIEPDVELIDLKPHELMEVTARNCYKSRESKDKKSRDKFLVKIIGNRGHRSILEHVGVSFRVDIRSDHDLARLFHIAPDLARSFDVANIYQEREDDMRLIISGNLRMFYEAKIPAFDKELSKMFPMFFNEEDDYDDDDIEYPVFKECTLVKNEQEIKLYAGENWKKHIRRTFKIVGSRAMQQQLTRHRRPVYSIESMRFIDYVKKVGIRFVAPPESGFLFKLAVRFNTSMYYWFRNMKPENRRSILGLGVVGDIYATATVSEWEHIIKMRTNEHAQEEIRSLASKMNRILQ